MVFRSLGCEFRSIMYPSPTSFSASVRAIIFEMVFFFRVFHFTFLCSDNESSHFVHRDLQLCQPRFFCRFLYILRINFYSRVIRSLLFSAEQSPLLSPDGRRTEAELVSAAQTEVLFDVSGALLQFSGLSLFLHTER